MSWYQSRNSIFFPLPRDSRSELRPYILQVGELLLNATFFSTHGTKAISQYAALWFEIYLFLSTPPQKKSKNTSYSSTQQQQLPPPFPRSARSFGSLATKLDLCTVFSRNLRPRFFWSSSPHCFFFFFRLRCQRWPLGGRTEGGGKK